MPSRGLVLSHDEEQLCPKGEALYLGRLVAPPGCFDQSLGAGEVDVNEESRFSPAAMAHQAMGSSPPRKWRPEMGFPPSRCLRVFSVTRENDRSWKGQKATTGQLRSQSSGSLLEASI